MPTPTPQDEAELDATRAPLLDHLIELRNRLLKAIVAFFLAFGVCYFFSDDIYGFLVQPLARALEGQPNQHLIYTAVYETFFTYVRLGAFGGLCLAFPYLASQIWAFIAPGLYRHERNAFWPYLVATPVMFLIGAAFVYYLMMPQAIRFFLGMAEGGAGGMAIELQARVSEYLSFVTTLIFAFGLCFQLPILLILLARVGIIDSKSLTSARRYAIVGIVAVAAVVTPPDPFSQLALAVPMWLLYELAVLLVRLMEKRRSAAEAAERSRQLRPT